MRRERMLAGALALAIVGTGVPAIAHESLVDYHLESGNRCTNCPGSPYFHWDFYFTPHFGAPAYEASVYQGTNAALSECMVVRIGGIDVGSTGYGPIVDRRFQTTPTLRDGIEVVRDVWVPEEGVDFARWVDSFRNTGVDEEVVNVQYYCYYAGCGGGGFYFDGGFGGAEGAGDDCTVGSSDGDLRTEDTDQWFAWNDDDDSGKPAVAIVTHGYGGLAPRTVTYSGFASFTIDYRLTIPAGATERLMLFLVQANDDASASATADFLTGMPEDAIAGLDPLPALANWVTDGHPQVSAGGPYECPEGGEVGLEPWISDREGDPLEWGWNFDDDPELEDDAMHPTFSAAGLDGPLEREITLHVEESGGTNPVDAPTTIDVVNVAPIVVSEPVRTARRGGLYTYTPTVVDPGTASGTESMAFDLVTGGEDRIEIDERTGTVTWEPRQEDLGDHEVEIHLEDDDGGEFTQAWTITVTDNEAPYPPNALYPSIDDCVRVASPTLKVSNATDLDEDRLRYFFEVDTWARFDGVELQRSPEEGIAEGISGFTEWRVPRPLRDGETYYWRTWTHDGIEASETIVGVFEVCLDEPADDAGVDPPPELPPDCACRTTAGGGGSALAWTLAAAIAITRRRRSLAGIRRRE